MLQTQETAIAINSFEPDSAYTEALDKSIEQAEAGDEIVLMTMEDFVACTPKNG